MKIKSFQGFTLVEMLVVMGILIILMTMGIAAGRFAIQRANKIQHQNATDQLYQGLQAYYADKREFPSRAQLVNWSTAMTTGVLSTYVDSKAFDGGGDTSFYYMVGTDGQSVIVCVSNGGVDNAQGLGGYCQGNGFGILPAGANKVTGKEMASAAFNTAMGDATVVKQAWSGDTNAWQ
jgi:prepilin-type N-terminal cleavage/methylation domain-containing protein